MDDYLDNHTESKFANTRVKVMGGTGTAIAVAGEYNRLPEDFKERIVHVQVDFTNSNYMFIWYKE